MLETGIKDRRTRLDFILDPSLVLYLPLYELDGGSFMSKDHYGHLATVTGALWTPQGRTFDGVDDQISLPASSALTLTGGWSAIGWLKFSSVAGTQYVFGLGQGLGGGNEHTGDIRMTGGVFNTYWNKAVGYVGRVGTTNLSIDTWYHIAVVHLDNAFPVLYLNAVAEGTTDGTVGLYAGTNWKCLLGTSIYDATNDFSGVWGEVLLYNRALTLAEITHHRLATKWRS